MVPLVVLSILIAKAFQISVLIAGPIDKIIPIESVAGVAFVNLLAIALILLVCYGVGLAVRKGVLGSRMERLDGILIEVVPGYVVAKGLIGSVAKEDDVSEMLTPVMVSFDDCDQIAFEVEHDDTRSVLFLPGSPSVWSGTTIVADRKRVRVLNIPMHRAVKLLRLQGRGSIETIPLQAAE